MEHSFICMQPSRLATNGISHTCRLWADTDPIYIVQSSNPLL